MNLYVKLFVSILLLVFASVLQAQSPDWSEVAPGVWKAVIGRPDSYDLLKAGGTEPDIAAISKMGETAFPLDKPGIFAKVEDGRCLPTLSAGAR